MSATSRLGLRRIWFQVHKWIGLLLAVAIIPLCLTGSALVWHDWLDEQVNPQRYALSSASAALPVSAYAAAAERALGAGERISSIRFEDGHPVVVTAARPPEPNARGRPVRTMIWLDPGTAKLLDKGDSSAGLVRVMHVLHGSLMIPEVGRQIVGWIGVAMLISSISGLWLWWPTVGRWIKGLRWRRHRNLDTNLHHQFGFWIALPLFALSLTGVWISFPPFFAALMGEPAQQQRGDPMARFRARPLNAPVQTVDGAVQASLTTAQDMLVSVAWPTDQKAEWTIALAAGEGPPREVAIVDASGAVKPAKPKPEGAAELARTMRKVHDGTDMGVLWQVVIFLGGLLPSILAVTGVIMWWRARAWRADRGRQRTGGGTPATEAV